MKARDLLDEIQANAASRGGNRIIPSALKEFPENSSPVFPGQANPVVPEANQQGASVRFKGNVDPGLFRDVVLDRIDQDVHQEHFKQRCNDRINDRASGRVLDLDRAVPEQVAVFVDELPDRARQVHRMGFTGENPGFDAGEVQDAVDVDGKTLDVLNHETDVLELLFAGQLVSRKGFQKQFEGGDGGLELMREVVDECVLQAIEPQGFEVVDEDDENAQQDDADQDGEDKKYHPGSGLEKLGRIEVVPVDDHLEARADPDIPVDV